MVKLDVELKPADVREISNADDVAAFFARLSYNTDARIAQTPANLGISSDGAVRPIKKIELLAEHDNLLYVYLFEVSSVTMTHTRELARAFRNLAGNYLLVLTSDYERIDFVFLERILPTGGATTAIGQQRQVGMHPRVLTVRRRDPETTHIRVLRRFTYTESEPVYQYEKLRSAFSIAYWSEEYFNNRALFSDYFLKKRLPDEKAEWREDPKPAFIKFRDLYRQAPTQWARKTEKVLRKELFEPVFDILGFKSAEDKPSDSDEARPDYRLLSTKSGKKPLALCLTYPWGRWKLRRRRWTQYSRRLLQRCRTT